MSCLVQNTPGVQGGILNVLGLLCACGFLRAATRLCVTSKAVAAAAPMGTGRHLYDAVVDGNEGQLRVFLEYWRGNRDINEVLNWTPGGLFEHPLAAAARWGRQACLELLLSFAPAVDINKGHGTALYWASRLNRAPMVRALLAAPSINVNKATPSRRTPLHEASQHGHAEVVRNLVAFRGISLEAQDGKGMTPLGLASQGRKREVVAILTEAIKKRRLLDAAGQAVSNATAQINMAALEMLVVKWSGNEDVLDWDDGGRRSSPFSSACFWGHFEVARLLVSTPGVDVNKVSGLGYSPLQASALHGNVDAVRFLLTVDGVDINKRVTFQTWKGKSALSMALTNPNGEIAAMLRAAGAQE